MLGERADETARLEEAVAAYREALRVFTRERVPLDWAKSPGNQGEAMMWPAERENDAGLAKNAPEQIETAYQNMQAAGHAPYAAYYQAQLTKAQALVQRLRAH